MVASQANAATANGAAPNAEPARDAAANRTPRPRLMAGPTSAIRSSVEDPSGWPPSSETPPSSHSVIRRTGRPTRLTTKAWASSWASNDPISHQRGSPAYQPVVSPAHTRHHRRQDGESEQLGQQEHADERRPVGAHEDARAFDARGSRELG
jgi:hypothetical protein